MIKKILTCLRFFFLQYGIKKHFEIDRTDDSSFHAPLFWIIKANLLHIPRLKYLNVLG